MELEQLVMPRIIWTTILQILISLNYHVLKVNKHREYHFAWNQIINCISKVNQIIIVLVKNYYLVITSLNVDVDSTYRRMKLSVNNRCVMSRRLGYSRVKLTLLCVKIETKVFNKRIETGEHKNYWGLSNVEQSLLLEIVSMSHSGCDSFEHVLLVVIGIQKN